LHQHLREYLSWKNSLFKQNNLNKSAGGSSFIKADNGKKTSLEWSFISINEYG